uniref:Uncharacterized protein n=1 Tax=Strigamia maritima TaxID=126957 RepID=T1JIB1_STRMM
MKITPNILGQRKDLLVVSIDMFYILRVALYFKSAFTKEKKCSENSKHAFLFRGFFLTGLIAGTLRNKQVTFHSRQSRFKTLLYFTIPDFYSDSTDFITALYRCKALLLFCVVYCRCRAELF